MRVKPVDPNAVIRDPHTKRPLPAEGGEVPEDTFWTRRWLAGEVMRWTGDRWERRLPSGQVVSIPDGGGPVRAEPTIPPLTTR